MNEEKQPLKKMFCKNRYSSKWLFSEYQADFMFKSLKNVSGEVKF